MIREAPGVLTAALMLLLAPTWSDAQTTSAGRVLVTANVGGQLTTTTFAESARFEAFAEEGRLNASYTIGRDYLVDFGVAVRLWGLLGAGASISIFRSEPIGTLEFRAPHPFFFDRHRTFSAEVNLTRREIGTHLQALVLVPAGDRIRVVVSGGPSIFRVEHDLLQDVRFEERFPFDDLVGPRTEIATSTDTAIGFNIGGDVTLLAGRHWGVGGLVRYARATTDLTIPAARAGARTVAIDVGGVHVAGGIRFLF